MDLMEYPSIEQWEVASRRAELLAGQLAQLHAELVDLTAQVIATNAWAGEGIVSPEHWLMLRCALSPVRAREIVTIARRQGDFPELERRLHSGSISVDQLAVVAKHVPLSHAHAVTGFVEAATVPQLRRVLPRYHFPAEDVAPTQDEELPSGTVTAIDDGPTLSMGTQDGRFRLHFEADPLDGALVETALREAKDALFTAGDATATLADALLEMASRSLTAVESPSRRDHYKVLVHLETDGRGWIKKQGALPRHLLRKLTCEGTVRPVWLENASPVSVGRAMRIVPSRTRALVEDRDQGCRYPGCTTTRFLENHHLTHWADGGATDIETVLSLCPRHHREHHQGNFTIEGTPTTPDGLTFLGRYGHPIRPALPHDPPAPTHPPPEAQPIRGWPLDTRYLDFGPPITAA
ncbi:hypothetical protein BW730_04015 [Tessaracoccus aquimaris]|uniref:HNH nuclease domain-containing protein n=1 Tax=Tessaracoccus aquimaris TaxID=1332264 RepID=A0A1Q2CL24_9ACTN|nr:HNH endonuclease signature motif containing protein [Tessaracoccus aquimaris]AQP46818.1 hypothetical protein BW730_04015 [Tessaracoccus aquimaris]